MKQLLDDLLDFSRASLDLGIPVSPASMDLAVACREEIELQRAAWPHHAIELTTVEGPTEGVWDASRLRQVLGNLIANAAKYGDPGTPINVSLLGEQDEIVLSRSKYGAADHRGRHGVAVRPVAARCSRRCGERTDQFGPRIVHRAPDRAFAWGHGVAVFT
jgi:hypothetical protein